MSNFRLGLFLNLDPRNGGVYQYGITMLEALAAMKKCGETDADLVLICAGKNAPMRKKIEEYGLEIAPFDEQIPLYLRALNFLSYEIDVRNLGHALARAGGLGRLLTDRLHAVRCAGHKKIFDRFRLDLAIFPVSTPLSFESGIPYIMAVHDLQHRLHPEFPEVSANGEWERREHIFRNGTAHATRILVDSLTGKEDVLQFYGQDGLTADRVDVLPYLPANYLVRAVPPEKREQVKAQYHLPDQYLFYPAQFWPHKNHLRIVQALGYLKDRHGLAVHVVFSGSAGGDLRKKTYDDVMKAAGELGVGEQTHCPGYVPEADISSFYANATGLIMPTFFGPTNIPPLEAWAFGCPVITSDIRGIREQMGDAAILVDPCSHVAIAEGIYRLWTDEDLRKSLVDKGKKRLGSYTKDDFKARLKGSIDAARQNLDKKSGA